MADQEMDKEQDAQTPAHQTTDVDTNSAETADASAQDLRGDETPESVEAMAHEALDDAEHAAQAINTQAAQMDVPLSVDLPEFGQAATTNGDLAQSMGLLSDVSLDVTIELGRTQMYVEDVLRLNANSIVELDKAAGDPVDIYVNDCHVARGEVLVLNENFCVRVNEIVAVAQQAPPQE